MFSKTDDSFLKKKKKLESCFAVLIIVGGVDVSLILVVI